MKLPVKIIAYASVIVTYHIALFECQKTDTPRQIVMGAVLSLIFSGLLGWGWSCNMLLGIIKTERDTWRDRTFETLQQTRDIIDSFTEMEDEFDERDLEVGDEESRQSSCGYGADHDDGVERDLLERE